MAGTLNRVSGGGGGMVSDSRNLGEEKKRKVQEKEGRQFRGCR